MKPTPGTGRCGGNPAPSEYRTRTYRRRVSGLGLEMFQVVCQETDLHIQADCRLDHEAREQALICRSHIEGYIERFPDFQTSLRPWCEEAMAPQIVRRMIAAGRTAGVGPMAAVAGAVAESVGQALLRSSREIVVENGGDIFLRTDRSVVAGLFAGPSPLSMKIGLRLPPSEAGLGMCTSSGTVGHSLSAGSADAVCVLSASCALADAAATAIGNQIQSVRDIQRAIDFGRGIPGVHAIVVVAGRDIGAWGQAELIRLTGKKG